MAFASGKDAVDALPSVVRVGAFDFDIEKWKRSKAEGAGRYGECALQELVIRVQEDFAHPTKAADTFIHELMHAIHWVYGMEDGDKEERLVNMMSTAMVTAYRDNPWMLGWLADCVTSNK